MELQVFIGSGCEVCDRALSIISEIGKRFPGVMVKITDISETNSSLPEEVFAVPTYMLDGRVVSLGNPDVEDLARLLETGVARPHPESTS